MLFPIILFAVLALASFLFFNLLSKAAKSDWGESKNSGYKTESYARTYRKCRTLRVIIPIIFLLLMILGFIIGGIKIIDATEIGVVRTFGRINHTITGGLNFVNPISDTVDTYDLKVHIKSVDFESYTKDAQSVQVSADYQYRLRPEEVMSVAYDYGSYQILETKLQSVVEEKVKTVFSRYGAMPLLENRNNLSPEVEKVLKELEDIFHIDFTVVVVRDIVFSDAFEASVEAKMKAEQDALRAEQEKKTAVVKAQQEKEVATINAEAAVEKARGEAEAIKIVRDALKDMPEEYIEQLWIDKWDGKLPTFMAGQDATMMVSIPVNAG